MPAIDIKRWISTLLARLGESRQRRLLSFQGPRDWCDVQLDILSALEPRRLLFATDEAGETGSTAASARAWLGGESRVVVVDLFGGFDPDALCIAAGLVRAGGLLCLLSPPVKKWDPSRDRYASWQDNECSPRAAFVEYFFAELGAARDCADSIAPDSGLPEIASQPQLSPTRLEQGLSGEQAAALRSIEQWFASGKDGLVLLEAARGRGKSHCLGLLCNRLGSRDGARILLSAASRRAANHALQVAAQTEFFAPDRLLLERPAADLVIIDEAASIPLSLLQQIREAYPRLVLATTSRGYEGTGQGFMLRFIAGLDSRDLLRLSLTQPLRWCEGDRLEAWIDRVLMLSPASPAGSAPDESVDSIDYRVIDEPGADELLRQVYALLGSAHYRTRPSDLRMLMENPARRVIVACAGERVVGATLLNLEGGFDADLCREVYLGRRRPRGHLLAQMLTAQAGVDNFATWRGLRVVRIAVDDAFRRRGIASRMIDRAEALAGESGCAWLGASFALDAETIGFWRFRKFALVHIGFAAGKSSGANSIAVLRALEPAIAEIAERQGRRIRRQLPAWLTQFLQTLDAEQVTALLRFGGFRAELDADELAEVDAFVDGHRGFELCFVSLQAFVMQSVAQSTATPARLLVEKMIQNRDWRRLARVSGSDGRRQLLQRLRGLVEPLRKA